MKRLLASFVVVFVFLAAAAVAKPRSQKPPINIGPLTFGEELNVLTASGKLTSRLPICVKKAFVTVTWNGHEVGQGESKGNGAYGPIDLLGIRSPDETEIIPVERTGTFKVSVLPPNGEAALKCRRTSVRVFKFGAP